jgi:hypothetical protein
MKKIFLLLTLLLIFSNVASAKTDTEKIEDISKKTEDILNVVSEVLGNVRKSMSIHGTEYFVNETGKIFIQLTEDDVPVNDASCKLDVYFPNNTKFINYETMAFLENGIYYITTPKLTTAGTYMISASCMFPSRFLTALATGSVIFDGSNYANDYTSTFSRDLIYHEILSNPSTANIKTRYFFLRPLDIASNSDIESITVRWSGQHDVDGRTFNFYLFNYTSMTYNLIRSTTTRKVDDTVVTTLTRENISGFVHSNGSLIVELDSLGLGSGHYQRNDFLQLEFVANKTAYISQIYGSEELNVHDLNVVLINQTGNLNNSIFAINSSIFSKLYKIQDEIASVNDTVKLSNSSIQDKISELSQNIYSNFTYTNSLILIANNTMNFWGNTLNTTTYWLGDTLNLWGNTLEYKLDNIQTMLQNITIGNVTVTALVDYDEIALTVLQYLKSVKVW